MFYGTYSVPSTITVAKTYSRTQIFANLFVSQATCTSRSGRYPDHAAFWKNDHPHNSNNNTNNSNTRRNG